MTKHTALPWRHHHPLYYAEDAEQITARAKDEVIPVIIASYVKPANARFIVTACNCHADLLEALKEIAKGEGAYSRDPLKHASNAVVNMRQIAREAIRKAEETP